MKISLYPTVKSQKPSICNWETFLNYTESKALASLANRIRRAVEAGDTKTKDELKKQLPIVTWQAWFEGSRKNAEAHPNGLFMLDIDHLKESPEEVFATKIAGKIDTHGIVAVHKTISCHGLRIVAYCHPRYKTLVEQQRWLANELMLDMDEACKDWARSSFLVPFEYFLFLKAEIFNPDFEALVVLELPPQGQSQPLIQAETAQPMPTDQRTYKGKDLYDIAMQWLKMNNGGLPTEGERNTVLFKLASRMRYITDFNPHTIANNIPHCGLQDAEVLQLCTSACNGQRSISIPQDLKNAISALDEKPTEAPQEEIPETKTDPLPPLPPVFKEYAAIAPDDFKKPVILCLLPMLGTMGSKLRAIYLNGKFETPSFMVALEAPQASGKSFIEDVAAFVLSPIKQKDDQEREKEKEFDEQIKTMKTAGTGTKAERAEVRELLENKPRPIIRLMPATASITKLLIRMDNADGLHLFAMAVEIDTVQKAFKRGFSNLSDLLRCAFDNSEYGQEYATDTSFSGKVRVFYNTLYSGTPAAMRRFYTNSEDGTMSRTLFVTIPDQFGKKMPVWGKFDENQLQVVSSALMRLYETSIKDSEVQNPYVETLNYLNAALETWIEEQRQMSIKFADRTRNIFYRRCAELAFRAGMVAHFLYGESKEHESDVVAFSLWVANMMLAEFLIRINISNEDVELGNLFARQVYVSLEDEFTRTQLEAKLREMGFKTTIRSVLYKWKQAGKIKTQERYGAEIITKVTNNGEGKIHS